MERKKEKNEKKQSTREREKRERNDRVETQQVTNLYSRDLRRDDGGGVATILPRVVGGLLATKAALEREERGWGWGGSGNVPPSLLVNVRALSSKLHPCFFPPASFHSLSLSLSRSLSFFKYIRALMYIPVHYILSYVIFMCVSSVLRWESHSLAKSHCHIAK